MPELFSLIRFMGILGPKTFELSSFALVVIFCVEAVFHCAAALGLPELPTVITLLILNRLNPVEDY